MSKADPVRVPPLAQAQATPPHYAESEPCAEDDSSQSAERHITTPLHSKTEFLPGSANPQDESAEAKVSHSIGPGTVLGGRYLLGKVIGTGGMCTVFEGLDRQLVSQGLAGAIAVKVVNPEFREDPASALGLQREFECMMKLQHPGMVRGFDLSNEHGTWFLTMELLSGETLAHRLRTYLASQKALQILLQCAQALAHAHEQGIVHGDLKPGNIFLTSEGVHLLDFGSAWRQHEIGRRDRASATPAYASPQVLQASAAEPRDDLFSLGCVAYELFTGQHPFNGLSSLDAQQAKLRPIWFPRMPARYFASIARMLAWERSDRQRSVHEFLDSLAAADARYSGSLTLQLRPPGDEASRSNAPLQPIVATALAVESTPGETPADAGLRPEDTAGSEDVTRAAQQGGAHFVAFTSGRHRTSEHAARAFAVFSGGRSFARERPGERFKTTPISDPAQQSEPVAAPASQARAPTSPPVIEPVVELRKPAPAAPAPRAPTPPSVIEPVIGPREPAPAVPVSRAPESAGTSEPAIIEVDVGSPLAPPPTEGGLAPESPTTPEWVPEPPASSDAAAEPVFAEEVEQDTGAQSTGTGTSQPELAPEPARKASSRGAPARAIVSYATLLRQPLSWMGRAALAAPQGIRHAGQRVRAFSGYGMSRLALYPAFKSQRVIAALACAVLLAALVMLLQQAMENKVTVQKTAERTRQMDARRERLATSVPLVEPRVGDMAMPELDPTLLERPARVATGMVSFKSERVYVAPGQEMAAISLSREQSSSGAARVGWRAVPLSAKPGVDFELPETQVVRFNEGQSVRTLYIPIKRPVESRVQGERRFQVILQQMPGGPAPKGIERIEVVIASAAAR